MNIAALVGNVASDPDLRHTSTGRASCSFRLAVSRLDDDQADFFRVVTNDRQAVICKEYLQIGRRVSIQGRLCGRFEPADQADARPSVEIVAHRVELLRPRSVSCRSGDTSWTRADRAEAVR